jgi:RNase P subunit RPR2
MQEVRLNAIPKRGTMKKCYNCKKLKPKFEFSRRLESADTLYYNCKDCAKEMNKRQRQKIKEGTIEAF